MHPHPAPFAISRQPSAAIGFRSVRRLAVALAGTVLGALPAFGQFAGFSSYTSPTTPMSWNTPSGNIGVTFGVSVNDSTVGLTVWPNEVGQFNGLTEAPPVNPAFTSLYPMASYQNLNVGQETGQAIAPVTETLTFQYSQPVNFASSLIFLDIGGSSPGLFDGPMIGTISATLGGVAVSTSTWQFTAFDDQTPVEPVSYTWDAATGQFDVTQFISSIAGILTSDGNTPFDELTISYQTCSWDRYGLAQYANPAPEPSSWGLLGMGMLCIHGVRRWKRGMGLTTK